VLAAGQIGDPAEDERAKEGGAEHRRVQQGQPARAQMPLLLDQR